MYWQGDVAKAVLELPSIKGTHARAHHTTPWHTPLSLHNAQLNLSLDIQKAFQSSSLYEIWVLEISMWILPQTLISCVTSGPASSLWDQFPHLSNQDDNFSSTKPADLVQIGWQSCKSPLWQSMDWMTICRRHVLCIHHARSFWEMISSLTKRSRCPRDSFVCSRSEHHCTSLSHIGRDTWSMGVIGASSLPSYLNWHTEKDLFSIAWMSIYRD